MTCSVAEESKPGTRLTAPKLGLRRRVPEES